MFVGEQEIVHVTNEVENCVQNISLMIDGAFPKRRDRKIFKLYQI